MEVDLTSPARVVTCRFPEDLRLAVRSAARRRRTTASEIIREAVRQRVGEIISEPQREGGEANGSR